MELHQEEDDDEKFWNIVKVTTGGSFEPMRVAQVVVKVVETTKEQAALHRHHHTLDRRHCGPARVVFVFVFVFAVPTCRWPKAPSQDL